MRVLVAMGTIALIILIIGGCEKRERLPKVRLHPTKVSQEELTPPLSQAALRIGVAPVVSPREAFPLYLELQSYLEKHLHRPVMILHRRTYAEINNMLQFGQCDMAFVCGYAYVQGHHTFNLQALVIPVVGDQNVYYSYVIVPASSPAQSFQDLRGKVFAFSDPLSNSGHLAPRFKLAEMGERPETFFRHTFFTYSHDRSVRAVASCWVDSAAVDSLVYQVMAANDPSLRTTLRIIERLGPFGIPPVVVRPTLDEPLKVELRQLLLQMHKDADGREVLEKLGIDRFAQAQDEAYGEIRRMARLLGELP